MAKLRYNLYIINSIHFKVLNDLNYFSDFQQIDRFVQPSLPSSFLIFPSPRKLPMPDSGLSNSHAEPQETASLLSVSADSPALDVSRNGIMRCVCSLLHLASFCRCDVSGTPLCCSTWQYLVPFHR